jgi:hypothetical protein
MTGSNTDYLLIAEDLYGKAMGTDSVKFVKGKRVRVKHKQQSIYGKDDTNDVGNLKDYVKTLKARLYADTAKANINKRKSQIARQMRGSIYQ